MNPYQTQNHSATAKLIEFTLLIKTTVGLLVLFLASKLGDNPYFILLFRKIIIPLYIVNIATCLICRYLGHEKTTTVYIMMTELILSFAISYLVFNDYVILFMMIPVILSTRSLNRKETHLVGFFTWICFVVTMLLNFKLHYSSLLFYNMHVNMEITRWEYPITVFVYSFVPTTFAFIMVMIVTDNIIVHGKKQIETVLDQTSKIAVLNSELSMAAQIQENALPYKFFETQDKKATINAEEKPAKEVGGDFFDYIMLDKTHLAFLVADVSDKGVSAAMFMMAAQKTLRIAITENKKLSDAIKVANNLLCQNNFQNMFLTLWIGVADLKNRTIEYINCGHQMPVLISKNGESNFLIDTPNLILGCFEGTEYQEQKLSYDPGDSLVLYTDGITDIRNSKDEIFGTERLLKTIKSGITNPQKLIKKCESFAGGTPQFDDMTVMEVCFN